MSLTQTDDISIMSKILCPKKMGTLHYITRNEVVNTFMVFNDTYKKQKDKKKKKENPPVLPQPPTNTSLKNRIEWLRGLTEIGLRDERMV